MSGVIPKAPAIRSDMATSTRGRRFPPEPLSRREVDALLRQCSKRAPTGIRNRALIAVLYRSGLRIGEALALRPADIEHENGSLRVLHGKGDRSREAGLDPAAFALLDAWLAARAKLPVGRSAPVFCTLKGRPLDPEDVRTMLHRKGEQAGIGKRVHPHSFRHTFACELRREGVDVGVISKALGHSSIATTTRYLDHIAPQAVIDTIRRRDWNTA